MKLANIESEGLVRAAVLVGDEAVDLTPELGGGADAMTRFLALGAAGEALAERCMKGAAPRLPISSARLRPPVLQADKILGVGMNYYSLIAAVKQLGISIPTERVWFLRPRSCLAGPTDPVWLPRNATDLDYEAELAVVIGRRCRYVTAADAPAVVGGYTIANDMTLRTRILKSPVLGKSFDTHTPLGPWIVTPEELPDPHQLAIRTWVNGSLRQQSTTADMIANCYELIADISSICTLNPGDIILTGTPDGSGVVQRPPVLLGVGDVVKIEIEGIGVIENRVVDEPPMYDGA